MRAANEELLSYAEPDDPRFRRALIRGIERISGQREIARLYQAARRRSIEHPEHPDPSAFFGHALDVLGIRPEYDSAALERIPRDGPLVFVANHPFGVVDGLALCKLAIETRGDVRILIHRALFRDADLQSFMLPVDFAGTREAAKRNLAVRDEALSFLRQGGTVAVFPGGGISTAQGSTFGPVTDLEWKLFPAKLIKSAKASVVPVYFPGRNSRLFQWVSQFSQTLRLSLVIREINQHRGCSLPVRVGPPVPYAELEGVGDKKALTEHLRALVYALDPGQEPRRAS